MIWQDFVFLIGSMTSVLFLYPTLRDSASQVPRATSVPSMIIGGAYSMTFFTLGMTFSAFGSFSACTMWSLIAAFRSPDDPEQSSNQVVNELRSRLLAQYNRFRPADAPSTPTSNTVSFDGGVDGTARREGPNQCDD